MYGSRNLPFCGNNTNLQNFLLGDVGVGGSIGALAGLCLGSVIMLSLHGSVVLSSAEMFATLFLPTVVGLVSGAVIHNRWRVDAINRQSPDQRAAQQSLVVASTMGDAYAAVQSSSRASVEPQV